MSSFSTIARVSGVAAATTALVGAGLFSANTAAAAEDQPIEPADAPEIMELAWPEYEVGDTHTNIKVVSNYLIAENFWDQQPTEELTDELAEAVQAYQEEAGLEVQPVIAGEMWDHFSDGQFEGAFDWSPGDGRNFYTQGDTGEGVEGVQLMLIRHGHLDEGKDDSQYGPETEAAVTEFQETKMCPELSVGAQDCVDGLTGEVTYRALVAID